MLGQSLMVPCAELAAPWVSRREKCCEHQQSALAGDAETEGTNSHETRWWVEQDVMVSRIQEFKTAMKNTAAGGSLRWGKSRNWESSDHSENACTLYIYPFKIQRAQVKGCASHWLIQDKTVKSNCLVLLSRCAGRATGAGAGCQWRHSMPPYMRFSVEIKQKIHANLNSGARGHEKSLGSGCMSRVASLGCASCKWKYCGAFSAMQDWKPSCIHGVPLRKRQQWLLGGDQAHAQMHMGCLCAW